MSKVIYRREAVADLQNAFDWYESRRRGLGDEFLQEVRAAERAVQDSPNAFRLIYRDSRRYLLRRFPYQLLYRVLDEVVVVVACFHVRRSPKVVRGRERGR